MAHTIGGEFNTGGVQASFVPTGGGGVSSPSFGFGETASFQSSPISVSGSRFSPSLIPSVFPAGIVKAVGDLPPINKPIAKEGTTDGTKNKASGTGVKDFFTGILKTLAEVGTAVLIAKITPSEESRPLPPPPGGSFEPTVATPRPLDFIPPSFGGGGFLADGLAEGGLNAGISEPGESNGRGSGMLGLGIPVLIAIGAGAFLLLRK